MSDFRQYQQLTWAKTITMEPHREPDSPSPTGGSNVGPNHGLDHDACYSAISRKDIRFDGRFYTGVTSTGIFCRPSCPARTPRPANVRFFTHTASAVEAGFRPCRRCRPELAPGHWEWNRRQDLVGRAVALIDHGALDSAGVADLAARLGVSERHLRREISAELGTGPLQLARTRRLRLARTLLDQTALTVSDVAFASGFTSIRQFNEVFRAAYQATPSQLRRRPRPNPNRTSSLVLQIPSRGPTRWPDLHRFLSRRAVTGLEESDQFTFTRLVPEGLIRLGDQSTYRDPTASSLRAEFELNDLSALPRWVTTIRQVCDLDTDLTEITEALHHDPVLAAAAPGAAPRLPGAFDPFEIAVRAVVGQQVSVASARTTVERIVAIAGQHLPPDHEARRRFPTPQELLAAPLDDVGMPAARRQTIRNVAQAVAEGAVDLGGTSDPDHVTQQLLTISGIGPWTAGYIVMRALHYPDGWPHNDLVVVRAVAAVSDLDRRALEGRSQQWKPWRAYAALTLWNHAGASQ